MARIEMQILILDDTQHRACPMEESFALNLTEEQCHQIAREMHAHFDQVAAENPAARAVADVLAHPPPEHSLNLTMTMRKFGINAKQTLDRSILASISPKAKLP